MYLVDYNSKWLVLSSTNIKILILNDRKTAWAEGWPDHWVTLAVLFQHNEDNDGVLVSSLSEILIICQWQLNTSGENENECFPMKVNVTCWILIDNWTL